MNDDVELCVNKTIKEITPRLIIGKRVSLGRMTRIGCDNEIILEDDVLIGPHVHISDRNHGFENIDIPINRQPIITNGPVRIGAETWIGFGSQIMSGVTIGKHCVIAAGSIVTKNIPDFCVAGGNPARVIKQYNSQSGKWERV